MVDRSTLLDERPVGPGPPEAVVREARRRQHHRWLAVGIVSIVLVVLGLTVARTVPRSSAPAHGHAAAPTRVNRRPSTRSAAVRPTQPGPLAVAPDGSLYLADESQNRILARLPSGRFRVIAGDGKAGFSGDGGPAVDAELNGPQGMAVAPNGTIYFADYRNNRIRAVSPDGMITTVAGDGQRPASFAPPASGTRATEANIIQPTAVAIDPDGSVYFAESANVLKIQPDGTLSVIDDGDTFDSSDPPLMPQEQCYPASLAFGGPGSLYIGCSSPWVLLVQTGDGTIRSLGYLRPHDAWAALASSPRGGVVGLYGSGLEAYGSAELPSVADFLHYRLPDGTYFWPQGLAVSPEGSLYLAQDGTSGIGTAAILQETPAGRLTVLWLGRPSRPLSR